MDIDSPSNKTQDEADDDDVEEEPSYNAELLELEPLREDSDDLLDDNDDDNDGKAQGSHSEDDDEDDDGKTSEPHEGSSTSSEEDDDDDEDEEDAHVQGLTSNEREILTLLAVDKVC